MNPKNKHIIASRFTCIIGLTIVSAGFIALPGPVDAAAEKKSYT